MLKYFLTSPIPHVKHQIKIDDTILCALEDEEEEEDEGEEDICTQETLSKLFLTLPLNSKFRILSPLRYGKLTQFPVRFRTAHFMIIHCTSVWSISFNLDKCNAGAFVVGIFYFL